MSTKRINKEFAEIFQSPPPGITVALPNNSTVHTWHVTLDGPPNTPYAPGRFGVILTLPTDYPFKPPVVKFVTRIYHPNVTNDSLGNVCLNMLKPDRWKPSTKIVAVLENLRTLLAEPVPEDPLEAGIAELLRNDRPAWEENVRSFVTKYATGDPQFPPTAT